MRSNYHYDDLLFYRLEDVFGSGFLKKCATSKQVDAVMEMLRLIARFDGKESGEYE